MRKIINLISLMFLLTVVFSCGSSNYYQSTYQNKEFNLNELNTDWPGATYSSIDQGMVYGITNDNDFLYAKLKVVEKLNQRKIIMNGLILWFDTDGKSKKKLGYAFPLVNETARIENNLANLSENDPALRERLQSIQIEAGKVNRRFESGEEAINVISEDGEIKETIPSHRNEDGINIMVYMDKYRILYYEARIPLDKIFDKNLLTDISKIPAFSYGFEIGELELGYRYQTYLSNPIAYRRAQIEKSMGMPGSATRDVRQSQMFSVAKIKDKATEVWVKQARLGTN